MGKGRKQKKEMNFYFFRQKHFVEIALQAQYPEISATLLDSMAIISTNDNGITKRL